MLNITPIDVIIDISMISLRSQWTSKLLTYLFLHETESYYVNELARILGCDRGNLVRKLNELAKEGLLKSEFRGNQKYYSINKSFPLRKEYRAMLQKTFGLEEILSSLLKKEAGVEKAWIFGSYAKNKMDAHSDIDLLIVGTHKTVSLYERLSELQKKYGREFNAVHMSPEEFAKKRKKKDPFLAEVFKSSHIQLV